MAEAMPLSKAHRVTRHCLKPASSSVFRKKQIPAFAGMTTKRAETGKQQIPPLRYGMTKNEELRRNETKAWLKRSLKPSSRHILGRFIARRLTSNP
jgi:hypothetical protein